MIPSRIESTGHYLPGQVLDNRALIERFNLDVDEAWIESRTGIKTRHWMAEDETTSDMAVEAARAVLAGSEIEAWELDRVILATISPDRPSPATAVDVAARIGARCAAFDLAAACSGFVYALDAARCAVAGGAGAVLVLVADARSRFVNTADRRGTVLFADGAAGALVRPARDGDPSSIRSVFLGAEGGRGHGAWIPAGGAARPASHETVDAGEHFVHVDGFREIFERFIGYTRRGVQGALNAAGWTLDEVDLFITHQGNAFLVDEIVKDLGVDPAKAVNDVHRHGNTSGASVGIALAEAVSEGRARSGDKVLVTTAGAGWTFGATALVL